MGKEMERLVCWGKGDMEERKRVGGAAVVVLRSFTFVPTSPQTSTADVRFPRA